MPFRGLHHAVLNVPDLPAAEAYYRELFEMDVLFREGTSEGAYGRLPDGIDWQTATAHGVSPGMSFLRRGGFVLALADDPEAGAPTRFDHISLEISMADMSDVASRAAAKGCGVDERERTVIVTDRYGIEWELTTRGFPPASPFDVLEL